MILYNYNYNLHVNPHTPRCVKIEMNCNQYEKLNNNFRKILVLLHHAPSKTVCFHMSDEVRYSLSRLRWHRLNASNQHVIPTVPTTSSRPYHFITRHRTGRTKLSDQWRPKLASPIRPPCFFPIRTFGPVFRNILWDSTMSTGWRSAESGVTYRM